MCRWADGKRDSAQHTMNPMTAHRHQRLSLPPAEHRRNIGSPWPELIRRTIGVDPEICVCGAKMIVDDAITEPEKITETLARLGIESTGPPKAMRSTGQRVTVAEYLVTGGVGRA